MLVKQSAEKAYSKATIALEPVQIGFDDSKKVQEASKKRKIAMDEIAPGPSTPEIKIEEPRRSPCMKKKSMRLLIQEQREAKREAKLLRMERSMNEILDFVKNLKKIVIRYNRN